MTQFLPEYMIYTLLAAAGILTGWLLRGRHRGETAVSFESAMRSWQRMTHAAEGALLDNVAATTPWLAPAIPAAIAYGHMRDYLAFSPALALVGALVVEFLGLAAVHTSFQLWEYNQQRNRDDEEAPFRWAVFAAAFYLAVIVIVNVLLETAASVTWLPMELAEISSKALLSLLSVDAAFVLALRTQHANRQAAKQERTTVRSQASELGKLRKSLERLETAVNQARAERDTAVSERKVLEQERRVLEQQISRLKQDVNRLEQVETELEQLRNKITSTETERKQIETTLEQLPADIRAAAMYVSGGGTMRELAEKYGTSLASISRAKNTLFPNGTG